MPTELAAVRAVHKPWGVRDLQPWSSLDGSDDAIGELWFEREGTYADTPALLLKLLFTSEPLSIQVHPDDTFARAMGLPNGKSEAWYILAAGPDAKVGVGLKHQVTLQQLRASIQNGSITELVDWRPVAKDDVIYIPAGTIHSIGAGIVLAEIQQRSDATFRLFDFGRQRELDEDNGVAVAHPWPLRARSNPTRLTAARTALIASRHFVLERVELPEGSSWALLAEAETWILVLGGHAAIGLSAVSIGQAIFVNGGRTSIEVGSSGLIALIAYPASRPIDSLLQMLGEHPASPVEISRPFPIRRPRQDSSMTPHLRIAVIGNSLPRRCGIATFTTDLVRAIANSRPTVETCIVAMNDHGQTYDYPASVAFQIRDDTIEDYARAAAFLNAGRFDLVCLQHEFGIFGGEAGSHILDLISRLSMPVVTTLHTVLAKPNAAQRAVMERLVEASSKIVVMASKGREMLRNVYDVADDKIEVIPHGIPEFPFAEPDAAKAKLGFGGRAVILTFGLLSPSKGIEVMIDAMPAILQHRPDAVYVVLGATHPNLVRDQGEAYRDSLVTRVHELGVENHVVFLDQFVDQATLLEFISMCDVYVTPYLNEAQMTSGTLAYSFGLGKPVVSTPYWHALELLDDGRGVIVPFGNAAAIGKEIALLLTDAPRRQAMRERAYAISRSMTWERTAERYIAAFQSARHGDWLKVIARTGPVPIAHSPAASDMQLGHFLSMCDDTGLFQHAVHSVPDRTHGYCVDDNARALLLACALNNPGEKRLPEVLTARFAAFVQHAWNPDTKRFRNFMGFNRTWLEDRGSEDSHGRTLWALGECARKDASPSRRRWAAALFAEALPTVMTFHSPRALAFTLLGLDGYCAVVPDLRAREVRHFLADRLMSGLASVETPGWSWFEEGLAYDNARLPQALMQTGIATQTPGYVDAGLRSLRWLMTQQTTPTGQFRPVGTSGFGELRQPPRAFDQQPVEATATIAACLTAWRADGDVEWKAIAANVFAWFLGRNDLSVALVDPETGGCRDGLHPDRANENRGGESVVSYLLGLADIRQLARVNVSVTPPTALRSISA